MEKKFKTESFYLVQNKLWEKDWYVYIGEKLDNATHTVKYVGRYAKRPCLSEARITAYEKENNLVSFRYHDKLTKEERDMDITIDEFIGSLIRHVPEKGLICLDFTGCMLMC